MSTHSVEGDAVLAALHQLRATLECLGDDIRLAREACDRHQRERRNPKAWHAIVEAEEDPRLLDLLNNTAAELAELNGGYRLALARVLRDEGLTLTRIAGILHVSRQRVAALLATPVS